MQDAVARLLSFLNALGIQMNPNNNDYFAFVNANAAAQVTVSPSGKRVSKATSLGVKNKQYLFVCPFLVLFVGFDG